MVWCVIVYREKYYLNGPGVWTLFTTLFATNFVKPGDSSSAVTSGGNIALPWSSKVNLKNLTIAENLDYTNLFQILPFQFYRFFQTTMNDKTAMQLNLVTFMDVFGILISSFDINERFGDFITAWTSWWRWWTNIWTFWIIAERYRSYFTWNQS